MRDTQDRIHPRTAARTSYSSSELGEYFDNSLTSVSHLSGQLLKGTSGEFTLLNLTTELLRHLSSARHTQTCLGSLSEYVGALQKWPKQYIGCGQRCPKTKESEFSTHKPLSLSHT